MVPGTSNRLSAVHCFYSELTTGEGILPLLFRELADAGERLKDHSAEDEKQEEKYPVLRCRSCNHTITSEEQRIEIAGSHHHTFFNPAGIVFSLGCFGKAPGCAIVGESSAEFSWFTGYIWRVAICAQCGVHLGWQFSSAETDFYGLVLTSLVSGEK